MESKTYKIVTGQQEVVFLQADRVELVSSASRLNLYQGDNLVGSFVGYSSFSVVEEVTPTA